MYQDSPLRLCLVAILTVFLQSALFAQAFITTWQTDLPGETTSTQIEIPTFGSAVYDYNILWTEVGNPTHTGTLLNQTGNVIIEFGTVGTYRVEITGLFPRIFFNAGSIFFGDDNDSEKILSVEQWGTNPWTSMSRAFSGCLNLRITASDAPDLSGVTDMSEMFYRATSLNDNINNWDVSTITNMSELFKDAEAFDQPLDNWTLNGVANINMSEMFEDAIAFNQDIGSWNVGMVTNMSSMFEGAASFNQNLNGWNVDAVTGMSRMFSDAIAFNGNISNWRVDNITSFQSMFSRAQAFNQDISGWQINTTSNVSLAGMFAGATSFNQDISFKPGGGNNGGDAWNTSMVNNMSGTFSGTIALTQSIVNWNVANVITMARMFSGNTTFNQDITGWSVDNVRDMEEMFGGATSFNQDISGWNTSMVDDMSEMFENATAFNQDLGRVGGWDISGVGDMRQMFRGASSFDQNLGGWDFSNLSGNDLINFLNNSGLSVANYDNLLLGLQAQIGTLNPISNFGAQNIYYCAGESAHAALVAFGWTFNDGGLRCIALFDGTDTTAPEIANGQPLAIDFGSISAGVTKTRSFTIENFQSITISNVVQAISTGTGTAFTTSPAPVAIAGGGTHTFTIDLLSATPGAFAETVTITSSNFGGSFQFSIIGEVTSTAQPEIKVFEGGTVFGDEIQDGVSIYNIGSTLRGNDIIHDVTITNLGDADLNISNISFPGSDFTVLSATALTIPIDGTEVVQIQLSGVQGGLFSEVLTIENDDANEAVFDFVVEGEIIGPNIWVVDGLNIFSDPEIFNNQVAPVDFGSSPSGSDLVRQLTITNESQISLLVSNISISGTAFSFNLITPFGVNGEIDAIYDEVIFEITLSGATGGTFNETVTITSDDDVDPIFTFPITGTIALGPEITVFASSGLEVPIGTTINLGSQVQGSGINETISIENSGTSVLQISNITVPVPFIINSALTFPIDIAAGDSQLIDIFLPGTSVGTFTETITLNSNASNGAVFDFQISGEITAAATPEIAVYAGSDISGPEILDEQAAPVNVGSDVIGNSITQSITIQNLGSQVLNLFDVSVSGIAFSISNAPAAFIVPGNTETFEIILDGSTAGIFTETLSINNDDADEALFNFQITGEITSTNSAPTVSNINDVTIDEDASPADITFSVSDNETNLDDLIITAVSDNDDLISTSTIQITGTGTDRVISYILTPDVSGTATVTVTVDDGEATVSESFTVTVNAINDAPIITGSDTFTTPVNTPIEMPLSAFTVVDVDNEYPTGFSIIISEGSNYTASGTTVSPDLDFVGNLTVPIVINDGQDDSPVFDAIITVIQGEISVDIGGEPLSTGDIINFDDIPVGARDARELVITNSGTSTLVITEILIDGEDFRLDSPVPDPIPAGANATISIIFQPSSVGAKTATLTVRSESAADFEIILRASGLSDIPPIEIFNVVTTQQNGKHDFLEIRNIEFYESNRVYIYSRWGKEVFKTENYNNTDNRFIGNSDGGEELADGTYYYVIELNGGETVENGFFLLRR